LGHDFSLKKKHFYCIFISLIPCPLSQRELISVYYNLFLYKTVGINQHLLYFLERHASEVLNMLFTEWNLDDAIAVAREEAHEDGREAERNEILGLIKKGYTSADIENHFRRKTST